MPYLYLRIGSLAEIHVADSDAELPRGRRVIARTERGVELGEVVGPCRRQMGTRSVDESLPGISNVAKVLRATTDQDEWLIQRLARQKSWAVEECRRALHASGSRATLLDVDQVFDGGSLVMHFLGEVDEESHLITRRITKRYESIVKTSHLAQLMSEGCGPGCGTDQATGGGCGGSCSSCATGCGKVAKKEDQSTGTAP